MAATTANEVFLVCASGAYVCAPQSAFSHSKTTGSVQTAVYIGQGTSNCNFAVCSVTTVAATGTWLLCGTSHTLISLAKHRAWCLCLSIQAALLLSTTVPGLEQLVLKGRVCLALVAQVVFPAQQQVPPAGCCCWHWVELCGMLYMYSITTAFAKRALHRHGIGAESSSTSHKLLLLRQSQAFPLSLLLVASRHLCLGAAAVDFMYTLHLYPFVARADFSLSLPDI